MLGNKESKGCSYCANSLSYFFYYTNSIILRLVYIQKSTMTKLCSIPDAQEFRIPANFTLLDRDSDVTGDPSHWKLLGVWGATTDGRYANTPINHALWFHVHTASLSRGVQFALSEAWIFQTRQQFAGDLCETHVARDPSHWRLCYATWTANCEPYDKPDVAYTSQMCAYWAAMLGIIDGDVASVPFRSHTPPPICASTICRTSLTFPTKLLPIVCMFILLPVHWVIFLSSLRF